MEVDNTGSFEALKLERCESDQNNSFKAKNDHLKYLTFFISVFCGSINGLGVQHSTTPLLRNQDIILL